MVAQFAHTADVPLGAIKSNPRKKGDLFLRKDSLLEHDDQYSVTELMVFVLATFFT